MYSNRVFVGDVKITTDRLSAIYNVPDENIPNGTVVLETELIGQNLIL